MMVAIGIALIVVAVCMMTYHAWKLAEIFQQAAIDTLTNPFENSEGEYHEKQRVRSADLVELF